MHMVFYFSFSIARRFPDRRIWKSTDRQRTRSYISLTITPVQLDEKELFIIMFSGGDV